MIEKLGRRETISIDSIEAAHFDSASNDTERVSNTPSTYETQPSPIIEDQVTVFKAQDPPRSSRQPRSGRRVHSERRPSE